MAVLLVSSYRKPSVKSSVLGLLLVGALRGEEPWCSSGQRDGSGGCGMGMATYHMGSWQSSDNVTGPCHAFINSGIVLVRHAD